MLGKPVTVRIAHATITAPGGCISYQDIEIQGTPGDVDRALGAIFRSGVARLEAAPAPVTTERYAPGGPVSPPGPVLVA